MYKLFTHGYTFRLRKSRAAHAECASAEPIKRADVDGSVRRGIIKH